MKQNLSYNLLLQVYTIQLYKSSGAQFFFSFQHATNQKKTRLYVKLCADFEGSNWLRYIVCNFEEKKSN